MEFGKSQKKTEEWRENGNSLGKTNEVLMVGVHVGQLDVYQQHHLNSDNTLSRENPEKTYLFS